MPFTIIADEPPETVLSLKEAHHRWSQQSQTMHIAYRTSGGAWAAFTFAKRDEDSPRLYGFAYVSRLLTGRHICTSDLVFTGDTPKKALCKVLKDDARTLQLFSTWQEFIKAMAEGFTENDDGC